MLPGKSYTPTDLLAVAWRGRWLIIVPFVVVSVATYAVVRFLPDRYRSQTLVVVVPQRVPTSYVRPTVTAHIDDRLQMIAQQILSRTDLEQIITQFNLYPDRRRTWMMEEVVAAMRKDISLQVVEGNNAFRLQFSYSDPGVAQKVTAQLASLFIEENLKNQSMLSDDTTSFLAAQLDDTRRRLEGMEEKIAQYRKAHTGELPSQLDANMEGLRSSERQLQALAEAVNRAQDRQMQLQAAIENQKALPVAPAADADGHVSIAGTPAQQLAAARAALKQLLLRDTPEHPDVVQLQKQIDVLEQRVQEESPASPDGAETTAVTPQQTAQQKRVDDLQLQLEAAQRDEQFSRSQVEQTKKTIAAYRARIDAAPSNESDLATLTRDYSTLQDVYRDLLTKQESAQLAASLERRQIGEQFRVIDPADRPGKPYSPNRPLFDLIGVLAGLGLGLILVTAREYRDHSLRTEADVTQLLSLPVLALVPTFVDPLRRRRLRRRALWCALAGTPALAALALTLFWFMRSAG